MIRSIFALIFIFNISIFSSAVKADVNDVGRQPSVEKISVVRAAILGIVEGLTEYLPVSSTGHLILAGHFMGLTHFSEKIGPFGRLLDKDKMEAINSFNIVIQSGAILAVVGLYRRRVADICFGLLGKNPAGLKLFGLLVVAFLPAAIVGLPLHKLIEEQLFAPIPVAYGLIGGGILMIAAERFAFRKKTHVTGIENIAYWQAAIIGIA
ncbi:MAG TPA: undecaprenyl-diphosphate phosphatase, partial [Phycisphaerales bacterium]|nr:undecaprenyl-diphosphate phosphatase [Phycisphaerales bacterium]